MLAPSGQLKEEAFGKGEAHPCAAPPPVRLQRASGSALVGFKRRGHRSVLDELHQSGCCKVRLPKPVPGGDPEAVLINTAGGLTDGDEISCVARWGQGTRAAVTTQAAERIYRSRGGPATVRNDLRVAAGATALWLPQETILFDGGRLARRLEADIAAGGRLLACESTVFGRAAMGETVREGSLRDSWRVRLGGRLVFADGLALEGCIDEGLDRPATGGGARAIASLVYAGGDAGELSTPLRAAMSGLAATCGCSANGAVLVARILAREGAHMREALKLLLEAALRWLTRRDDEPAAHACLPRVWSC